MQLDLGNVSTDMAVIGFTGALGSGCTFLATGLVKHHGYVRCSLSTPIRAYARDNHIEQTTENLQNIGNELRKTKGIDYLAASALSEVNAGLPPKGDSAYPVGIVVDGIRNVGEIGALQQLPNFFLISVQAGTDMRKERTIGDGRRFKTSEEFVAADNRDRDEQTVYGQQVKECNYRADIIIINEEEVSSSAEKPYQEYIERLLYRDYVKLIEHVASGKHPNERKARLEESLMTAAYVESKRSSCLKRKVGAIVASPTGDIISAGHNEVPEGSDACLDDPRYGRCARDVVQETIGRKFKHCPNCGELIMMNVKCEHCGSPITCFAKRCPECKGLLEIEYACGKCRTNVFSNFLPGAGSERTGKLLDLCRALHAEENAILNLAKFGVRLPSAQRGAESLDSLDGGCVLYSTTFPCNLCANKIVTVGIRKVVYAEPYTMDEAKKVFQKHGVRMQRFQGVKSRAFFRLYA